MNQYLLFSQFLLFCQQLTAAKASIRCSAIKSTGSTLKYFCEQLNDGKKYSQRIVTLLRGGGIPSKNFGDSVQILLNGGQKFLNDFVQIFCGSLSILPAKSL